MNTSPVIKYKRDAPVARDGDAPGRGEFTLQLMKPESWQCQVQGAGRYIEKREYLLQPFRPCSGHPSARSCLVEDPESLMMESPDHIERV